MYNFWFYPKSVVRSLSEFERLSLSERTAFSCRKNGSNLDFERLKVSNDLFGFIFFQFRCKIKKKKNVSHLLKSKKWILIYTSVGYICDFQYNTKHFVIKNVWKNSGCDNSLFFNIITLIMIFPNFLSTFFYKNIGGNLYCKKHL